MGIKVAPIYQTVSILQLFLFISHFNDDDYFIAFYVFYTHIV